MSRIIGIISVAALMLLGGCGKEDSPPAGGPAVPPPASNAVGSNSASTNSNAPAATTGAPTATRDQLDAVAKASKPYRITLIVKTRNNPFFDPMIKAADAEAKALGVKLTIQAPAQETDKERQFALVQDVTATGADAILITPADSAAIVPALKQATEKKILVLNLDNRVDAKAAGDLKLGGYVGADNEEGGRLAGGAMVEALPKGGKVAILEGIRGADNAEKRKRGFSEAVKGRLEVEVSDTANWDTQQAYTKFQSMQAAHPDLVGLFCANDKMALGAIKAIKEGGKPGKITVVGYDNIPDIRPYLQSGEMAATIEQHPDLMGKYGIRMAVGLLDGKIPRGSEFLVPLEVVRGKGK